MGAAEQLVIGPRSHQVLSQRIPVVAKLKRFVVNREFQISHDLHSVGGVPEMPGTAVRDTVTRTLAKPRR